MANNNEALCSIDWKERIEIGINVEKQFEAKEERIQRMTEEDFSPKIFLNMETNLIKSKRSWRKE